MKRKRSELKYYIFLLASIPFFLTLAASYPVGQFHVHEIISVKTGNRPWDIGNQFGGGRKLGYLRPFEGFVVDSKGNIFIEDPVNERIQRFSNKGKFLNSLTLGWRRKNSPPFLPRYMCLDKEDNVYVHETEMEQIIVFSPEGKIIRRFYPGYDVFESLYRKVPIISLMCKYEKIIIAFGIARLKGKVRPIYVNEYDLNFKLIKEEIIDEEAFVSESMILWPKKDKFLDDGFVNIFEDIRGYRYSYRIEKDWYGKFLPLVKHSSKGDYLYEIDGDFLSKKTGYKVYDYYLIQQRGGWGDLRGKELLIVNWYVTPDGTIYALLANNDYIKVIKITEKNY